MIYHEKLGIYLPIVEITRKATTENKLMYNCAWNHEPFILSYSPEWDTEFGDEFLKLVEERPLQVGDILIPSNKALGHDDVSFFEVEGVLYMSDVLDKGIPVFIRPEWRDHYDEY